MFIFIKGQYVPPTIDFQGEVFLGPHGPETRVGLGPKL